MQQSTGIIPHANSVGNRHHVVDRPQTIDSDTDPARVLTQRRAACGRPPGTPAAHAGRHHHASAHRRFRARRTAARWSIRDSKSGELAKLWVRVFRSLDAIVGSNDTAARAWLQFGERGVRRRETDRSAAQRGGPDPRAALSRHCARGRPRRPAAAAPSRSDPARAGPQIMRRRSAMLSLSHDRSAEELFHRDHRGRRSATSARSRGASSKHSTACRRCGWSIRSKNSACSRICSKRASRRYLRTR